MIKVNKVEKNGQICKCCEQSAQNDQSVQDGKERFSKVVSKVLSMIKVDKVEKNEQNFKYCDQNEQNGKSGQGGKEWADLQML